MTTDPRFGRAIEAIDEAKAQDPNSIVVDGVERPKDVVRAERVTEWAQRFDPDASAAQLLAARAHHLQRWTLPRTECANGCSGY